MFRNKVIFAALLGLAGGTVTGCATTPRLEGRALIGALEQYEIATLGNSREILPASWHLMGYTPRKGDRPQKRRYSSSERVKIAWPGPYKEHDDVVWWTGWDAEFSHQSSNGSVLVGAIPRHPDVPSRNIDIIAKNIANDVSGSELSLGWRAAYGKRVASKIVSGQSIVLGGVSAYRVTFDVVNLDQREHDPNSPETRIDLVLSSASVIVRVEDDGPGRNVQALLMLIHSNDVASYAKTEPDFSEMLRRYRITRKKK
jgi:hypothetical protein